MKCKACKHYTRYGEMCEETLDIIEPGEVDCWGYKQATNADRIRAMSDEELAELLITADFCEECEYCDKVWGCRYYEAHPDGVLNDGCKHAAINWLGQPAEEDDHVNTP